VGGSDGGVFSGYGIVFELTRGAGGTWTETVLYNFGSHDGDGGGPEAGLIFDTAGNLYGTTYGGGIGPPYGGYGVRVDPYSGRGMDGEGAA
jgi:hypothetical protein